MSYFRGPRLLPVRPDIGGASRFSGAGQAPWITPAYASLAIYGVLIVGLIVWASILTPALPRSNDNKSDIKQLKKDVNTLDGNVTTLEQDINEINTTIISNYKAIVSKITVTESSVVNISSMENVPFNNVISDEYGLYNTTSYEWAANMDGWWQFYACVSFDQAEITGFPTNLTYDHQLQVYQNGVFSTQGLFLDIYTAKGDGVSTFQLSLCGENWYMMNVSDTISLRIQTRFYPATIVDSAIDGGTFVTTRGVFSYAGSFST